MTINDLASNNSNERVIVKFPEVTIVVMKPNIKIHIICNYVGNNGGIFSATVDKKLAQEIKCEKYYGGIEFIYFF